MLLGGAAPLAAVGQTGIPDWATLALLGLIAGLLALDDTALAQTWFSSPLTAGVIAGIVGGDPLVGLAIALPLQLALAGNLPVGQTLAGDPATAVVAVVGATLLGGQTPGSVTAAGMAADMPRLGWLILAGGLLSLAGHPLIQAERRAHALWMLEGHRTLRDGSLTRIERIHARCLFSTFVRGSVFGVLFTMLVLNVWLPLFDVLPAPLRGALGLLPLLVPALGLGGLIERYGVRNAWPWVAGGAVAAFLLAGVTS